MSTSFPSRFPFKLKFTQPVRHILLIVFSVIIFLFLVVLIHKKVLQPNENHDVGVATSAARPGLPLRLQIPNIDVNTSIQNVGVTTDGAMEVPSNAYEVGWFKFGPRPGDVGNAVIAGHINGEKGEAGVFENLHTLKVGDQLLVQTDQKETIVFVVSGSKKYVPGYANEVFSSQVGRHLNLITCEGEWNATTKSYSKRLVVFADILQK